MTQASIKVGMIAEETGALSFMGRANANVARMVVDEINTNGGLLGRKIELYLEDGAISPSSRVHEMSVPSPVNESLLSQRLGALGSARSWAPNVLSELERFIRTADDYDLFRINPIQYGGLVDLSEADAIELFVHAAKVGLFEMDWLLICAYCPQVAGSFRELDQLHPRFQCAFCNAINDVALDDYIQVTFTVSSGVRDIVFRHPEMLSVEDFYLRYT